MKKYLFLAFFFMIDQAFGWGDLYGKKWPPYSDSSLTDNGLISHIVSHISPEINVSIVPDVRALRLAKDSASIGFFPAYDCDENFEGFPFLKSKVALYVRAGETLNKNAIIGYVRGRNEYLPFIEKIPNVKTVPYQLKNDLIGLQLLATNRINGFVCDTNVCNYILASSDLSGKVEQYFNLGEESLLICLNKNFAAIKEFKDFLHAGLSSIDYETIMFQYIVDNLYLDFSMIDG